MRAILSAAVVGAAFAVSTLALAATDPALEKAMHDCFKKHAGLMDKPAIRNPRDCWRVHGQPKQE
jgi:hypothetical protein